MRGTGAAELWNAWLRRLLTQPLAILSARALRGVENPRFGFLHTGPGCCWAKVSPATFCMAAITVFGHFLC